MHVPDRTIVTALRRIDPGLSVAWVEPPGRWGVFHDVQVDGNPDEEIERLALEIQLDGARSGYVLSKDDCGQTARTAFMARKLVCYVVGDHGEYRSLDGRIVKKLERMDFLRRNCGLRDWRQMMDARADAVRSSRQAAQGDVWQCIRNDRVFASQVSDILWGVKPMRSVLVPEQYGGVRDANHRERIEQADPGVHAGQEADDHPGDGSGVAEAVGADAAVPGGAVQ